MPGVITNAAQRERESFEDPARGDCTWVTLFSSERTPTNALCGGVADLAPGGTGLTLHRHAQPEVYYILEGAGVVTIDGVETPIGPGDSVFIPGDAEHGVRNVGDATLRLFYVFPTNSFADVVYRFS